MTTEGEVTIRAAREWDLAEVLELERGVATAPHWGEEEYRRMVRGAAGEGVQRAMFVATAEGEGRLLGFGVGMVLEGEAELESVVVCAAARRRGLGGRLCRRVMEWSREHGAREMVLEVRAGSAGALRMYEQLGFVVAGRRAGYYRDPEEDAVVMRCVLPAGEGEVGGLPPYNGPLWSGMDFGTERGCLR